MHREVVAGQEMQQFAAIVRTSAKEHLNLKVQVVDSGNAGVHMIVVSGRGSAAGYQPGRTWPELFRTHLQGGYFD